MKTFILLIIFTSLSIKSYGQPNGANMIKINSNINALFKGDGLIFESIGLEHSITQRNSVGLWIGGNFKTSKLELKEAQNIASISQNTSLKFGFDYYYYIYMQKRNGVYLSPSVYYRRAINTDDKLYGYGATLNIGYRRFWNFFFIDCAVFYTCEYINQKTDNYEYHSREIKPIDVKFSVGYIFKQ